MDVNTTFLNGDLEEEIYMNQPEGCVVPRKDKKVCKLVKSLYGLKQAPIQWHNKFDHVLVTNGYSINDADKCIYSKYEDNTYVVICLYVIIGIKIKTPNGFKISQGLYVEKIIRKFEHFGCKPLKKNREHSVAQIEYAQIIGSLMYLMNCTRLDIAYAVVDMFSSLVGVQILGSLPSKLALLDIPLWTRPTLSVYMRCDSQATIAKAKSKIFNGKNKHIRLRHNIVQQLLETGIIFLEFVRYSINSNCMRVHPYGVDKVYSALTKVECLLLMNTIFLLDVPTEGMVYPPLKFCLPLKFCICQAYVKVSNRQDFHFPRDEKEWVKFLSLLHARALLFLTKSFVGDPLGYALKLPSH
ncbi:hypothetical protein AAG906_002240 [Vitis piasezkii]